MPDITSPTPSPLPPPPPSLPPPARRLAAWSLGLGIAALIPCPGLLAAVPAVICGHVAMGRARRASDGPAAKNLAVAGLVLGYGAMVLSFLVLTLGAILLPALAQARGKAREASCVSNVRQLSLACIMYANDHDMQFPADWSEVQSYVGDAQVLECPADDSGTSPDYQIVFRGRLSDATDPARTVAIRETAARHRGRAATGYVDGHCTMEP